MKRFNLRVYALIVNDANQILLMDECRSGYAFTKFPGGGLEFGEGLKDGLRRELKEELFHDFEIGELFYVNDFFQQSAFNPNDQLISFYFRVQPGADFGIAGFQKQSADNYELPKWVALSQFDAACLTFPVDRKVGEKLIVNY